MKRKPHIRYVIFLALLICFPVSSSSNITVSDVYAPKPCEDDIPQRQHAPHRCEKRLDVTFPKLEIAEATTYCSLRMAECSYVSKSGYPRLPIKNVVLKIPLYSNIYEVAVDIKGTSSMSISKPVSPAPAPVPLRTNETYHLTESSGTAEPDSTVYNAHELYPKDWFSYSLKKGLDPDTSTRLQYIIVSLYPARYLPTANEIVLAKEASVVVYYEDLTSIQLASSELENLIITSPTLEDQAVRLAAFKNSTGVPSRVVNTSWIYSNYPGADNQEQIRNCIKDFVTQHNIIYVTIFGDADQIPVRYAYVPDDTETYVATDLYYADLDGTWDDNGDGLYADLRYDNVDGVPDVYVGRVPPSLTEYAETAVNKIINFTQNFNKAYEWANRIVLVAGAGNGLGSATTALNEYIANIISNMSIVKLYESSGNLTKANLTSEINEGCFFLNFAGHGSPDSWLLRWIIDLVWSEDFSASDAFSLTNELKLPVITTLSCSTARFDDTECIAEHFVLNPNGGSIAYYGATRIAWGYIDEWAPYGLMGEMDRRIYEAFYDGHTELGKMWGVSIARYIQNHPLNTLHDQSYLDEKTVMEFVLLGDPTLNVGTESDTEPPTQPTDLRCTSPSTDPTPSFTWTASTDNSAVSGYYVNITGYPTNYIGNTTQWESPHKLPNGNHTFHVKATDLAGNNSTAASLEFAITLTAYTMGFVEGWNLMGVPLEPDDATIEAVFGENLTYVQVIYGYENGIWLYYIPGFEGSTLRSLEAGVGYWVAATMEFSVTINGTIPDRPSMADDWNLFSIVGLESVGVEEYLAGCNWQAVFGWDSTTQTWMWNINGGGGDLEMLEPGHGYWVFIGP